MKEVRRIFVQRKAELDIEATNLLKDIKENLLIDSLKDLKIIYRYDIEDIDEETYLKARNTIFSEPPVDMVLMRKLQLIKTKKYLQQNSFQDNMTKELILFHNVFNY